MREMLLKLLKLSTENEVVEFKEAKTQYNKDNLGEYFSALSNEANLKGQSNAWIIFGIKNNKSIVGTIISDDQLNDYKNEMAQHTSPRISFEETERIDIDGKNVILCKIPAAPQGQPVSWKGHYYGRDGESLGALHDNERDRIRIQNTALDWSAQVISEATIDDLSKEAIDFARKQYIEKNKSKESEIQQWDDATFLNKARVAINGKITRAAILLLGKSESNHYLNPAQAKISWILKDKDNIEKDYEHFSCPFILSVNQVQKKIRNLKYRYIKDGTLFPEEVEQYDPYIIRESLNNCIAHQDYSLNGKINVVEREDGVLVFSNVGAFIPESVEQVIEADAPESRYRNPFLSNAMVNLNLIDTIGSGIKRMYNIQRNKFFPLPDYDLGKLSVKVTIIGKILDTKYAVKLAQMPNLSLHEIILLDKVSKSKSMTDFEIKELKDKQLIEGRKPNFHISAEVAIATGEKSDYLKQRGIDDGYCQKMILNYLEKFGEGKREDFESLLLDKLPDVLDIIQKRNKIKNNLQTLRKQGKIDIKGKIWKMSKPE
ncbi:MAG: RNA-binding domain-containing protein [Saprospiraceae bacterium]